METQQTQNKFIAVIRLKGDVDIPEKIRYSLHILGLRSRYSCIVLPDSPSLQGMLTTVKDWVTWGEVDKDTLLLLLKERGRLKGNRPLTDDVAKRSGWNGIEDFVNALTNGTASLRCRDGKKCINGLKPFFRLHPPKGGLNSIKKYYGYGGDLGYRGSNINDLLRRML